MKLIVLLFCLTLTNAFYFYLEGSERKCFYKELSKDTLLVGQYDLKIYDSTTDNYVEASNDVGIVIDVEEVFDDDHRVVHQKGHAVGEFTFTALDTGDHRICLQAQSQGWVSKGKGKLNVEFSLGDEQLLDSKQTGKVKSLSEKVRALNNKVIEIKREQKLMRDRESQFRNQSEAVNSSAIRWSILQLIAFIATCIWQVKHLKTFFVKQKIV